MGYYGFRYRYFNQASLTFCYEILTKQEKTNAYNLAIYMLSGRKGRENRNAQPNKTEKQAIILAYKILITGPLLSNIHYLFNED